ncbi:hypothetical protein [Roseibium aggregatum]|uniref:Uncharacterized protein n=1 Tax=Roseibium aggregatum TaxID=187304 RepID=A0A939J6W3_9HYPH|nr:hypothetical protein [Roseibium aggregatum]MBN9673199.1 hypothetical protein [Roseibium aggregatum]
MDTGRQGACAHNNALWCNAVLTAAGATARFHAGFWQAEGRSLPLYPDIVTLSPQPGAEFFAALSALPANAAVKDSFDSLDLQASGFEKLLTGTWLFRPAQTANKPALSTNWQKITHSEGLKKWLTGWNENVNLHRVFPPSLLNLKTVDFAAITGNGAIKAGAVFNSGPKLDGKDLLGLTNVFCRKSWRYSALHDLLEPFPHRPVCTYEADDKLLPVYRQLGFESCGRLGVWVKPRPTSQSD